MAFGNKVSESVKQAKR